MKALFSEVRLVYLLHHPPILNHRRNGLLVISVTRSQFREGHTTPRKGGKKSCRFQLCKFLYHKAQKYLKRGPGDSTEPKRIEQPEMSRRLPQYVRLLSSDTNTVTLTCIDPVPIYYAQFFQGTLTNFYFDQLTRNVNS